MDTSTDGFVPQYADSLVKQIADYLTNEILEGRIESGQHLVESELQRVLGVSRTPIREAFRVLEQEGFLVNVARKGTYVRKITEQDIRDNFPIRANLEGLAARLATPHLQGKEMEELRSTLSNMAKAGSENIFKTYFSAHDRFHMIFIEACGNKPLVDLIKNLRKHSLWFRFSYQWHQENYQYAVSVHRKIVQLFEEKNEEAVEILVRKHILDNQNRYLEFLAKKNGSIS